MAGKRHCRGRQIDWARWKDRTITCNCLSKTFRDDGMADRASTAGPKALVNAMNKLQSQMTRQLSRVSACRRLRRRIRIRRAPGGGEDAAEFEVRGEHMWKRLNALPG